MKVLKNFVMSASVVSYWGISGYLGLLGYFWLKIVHKKLK